MKPKTCFISYSQDSPLHGKWVEKLAKKIQSYGVQVRLDALDNLPGDDIVQYMINAVDNADKVLIICTQKYKAKLQGGAAFEKMLISGQLAEDAITNKFIPILKEGDKKTAIPVFLSTKLYIAMKSSNIKDIDIQTIIKSVKKSNSVKAGATTMNINTVKKIHANVNSSSANGVQELSRIRPTGYTLLGGRGADGIRYLWKAQDNTFVESIAFNNRRKDYTISEEDKKISAYTTSVSFGCHLNSMNMSCSFCATGKVKFKGPLTSQEIALQNIFMAQYDGDCPSWPEVRGNAREFAFMGQGEPGYCYPEIRRAIQLTDIAMDRINQKVHRYVISTVGIPDMLDLFLIDLERAFFNNRVTLHFSLHAINGQRTEYMPINRMYNYEISLQKTRQIAQQMGEKVAIGILLFESFSSINNSKKTFTTSKTYLDRMLDKLDPQSHRIDLCDVNFNSSISTTQREMRNEDAHKLLEQVHKRGFEAKLFSSFGADKNSGCGMLMSSRSKVQSIGETTQAQFDRAVGLLKDIVKNGG